MMSGGRSTPAAETPSNTVTNLRSPSCTNPTFRRALVQMTWAFSTFPIRKPFSSMFHMLWTSLPCSSRALFSLEEVNKGGAAFFGGGIYQLEKWRQHLWIIYRGPLPVNAVSYLACKDRMAVQESWNPMLAWLSSLFWVVQMVGNTPDISKLWW